LIHSLDAARGDTASGLVYSRPFRGNRSAA
jgi:hypothetical protein